MAKRMSLMSESSFLIDLLLDVAAMRALLADVSCSAHGGNEPLAAVMARAGRANHARERTSLLDERQHRRGQKNHGAADADEGMGDTSLHVRPPSCHKNVRRRSPPDGAHAPSTPRRTVQVIERSLPPPPRRLPGGGPEVPLERGKRLVGHRSHTESPEGKIRAMTKNAARIALTVAFGLAMLNPLVSAANAQWIEHPAAVQAVYQSAVPHTDRTGGRLDAYDATKSFFPIVLYHALHGEHRGRRYDLADFRKAGFNAVHLWERQTLVDLAPVAERAGVQLIIHWPSDADIKNFRDHPAVLAWYLDEEPTGAYWDKDMAEKFAAFVKRREVIRAIDPRRAVFALDVPWITPPATEWWIKWATCGDVSAHDNYPINQHRRSLSFDQGVP